MFRPNLFLALLLSTGLITTTCSSHGSSHRGPQSQGATRSILTAQTEIDTPWALTFITPTRLLITQRTGALYLLDLQSNHLTEITGVPKVWATGQGGLLDIAKGPNYANEGWLYFTYSKPHLHDPKQAATALARAKLARSSLSNWQELLVTQPYSSNSKHFGSRIAFDTNGHVFFSAGDRGHRPNGQDLTTHSGTILRLNIDGSVPTDNPFINRINALPEIWSYGHRNPQGLAFDSKNKRLWAIEHGPRGGDELNLIEKGKNYGWPTISFGKEYWGPIKVGEGTAKAGMEQPIKQYTPSIAPGSLLFVDSKLFPHWQGSLLAGALKLQHLNRTTLSPAGHFVGEERLFRSMGLRIRALAQSPDGSLFFAADGGSIYRISPPLKNP